MNAIHPVILVTLAIGLIPLLVFLFCEGCKRIHLPRRKVRKFACDYVRLTEEEKKECLNIRRKPAWLIDKPNNELSEKERKWNRIIRNNPRRTYSFYRIAAEEIPEWRLKEIAEHSEEEYQRNLLKAKRDRYSAYLNEEIGR